MCGISVPFRFVTYSYSWDLISEDRVTLDIRQCHVVFPTHELGIFNLHVSFLYTITSALNYQLGLLKRI